MGGGTTPHPPSDYELYFHCLALSIFLREMPPEAAVMWQRLAPRRSDLRNGNPRPQSICKILTQTRGAFVVERWAKCVPGVETT